MEGAGLLGCAEEGRYEHLALVGLDGDQGRLALLVAYEIEWERHLSRPLGGPARHVRGMEEPGPSVRDHEHVVLPGGREGLHRAPVLEFPRFEPRQSVHPMLRSAGGELSGEFRAGEEDADGSRLAADFGLLENVPPLLVRQTVEGRTRQPFEGQLAGGIIHALPPC